jgi:hypothetical protein
VLAAAAAMVAACGGGARSGGGSARVERSGGGSGGVTRAQALAFARAVNLTADDLPGFRATRQPRHKSESGAEGRLERQMLACVGAPATRASLAEASSANFERQAPLSELSASSEVTVARTPASAKLGLGAIDSEHTRSCLSRYFNLLFRGRRSHGATFAAVSVSQGRPPAPGTSGSFGWRITTQIIGHGVSIPFYVDLLGFVYGPAEVSLLSSGAPQPFPAAAEQALYLLLLKRATAQHI